MYHTLEKYLDASKRAKSLASATGLDLNFGYMGIEMLDLAELALEKQCQLFKSVPVSVTEVDMRFYNFYEDIMEKLNTVKITLPNVKVLHVIESDINNVHSVNPSKLRALQAVFPNVDTLVFYDGNACEKLFWTPGEPARKAKVLGFKISPPSLLKIALSSIYHQTHQTVAEKMKGEVDTYRQKHAKKDMPYEEHEARHKALFVDSINALSISDRSKTKLYEEHEARHKPLFVDSINVLPISARSKTKLLAEDPREVPARLYPR